MPTSLLASPPSASKPRVEVHPDFAVSLAEPAIDLARRAGLVLDPWQQDALRVMLGVRSDGKWACYEYGEIVGRQNGKGAILEARVLAGLFLFGEELLMWSAHEYKTAMEAKRRVERLLRRLGTRVSENLYEVEGSRFKVVNTNGEESLENLDTEQRLKFIARSKGSGRGFSGDVNIIDEAFAYTRTHQEALMPTMSARANPQLIYTSSPPLATDPEIVMFSLRARAEAGGDDSLGWRDWGIAKTLDQLKDVDLDDPDMWRATNPSYGHRITREFIQKERNSMSDAGFARERAGAWPRLPVEDGWAVISEERWLDRLDVDSGISGPVALAVDVAPDRAHAAIASAGRRPDADRHVEVADHREGTAWVVKRVKAMCLRHKVCAVVVDGAGPAASLIPELERTLGRLKSPVKLHKLGAAEAAAAFGAFYDGFVPAEDRDEDDEPDTEGVDPTAIWHLDQVPLSLALAGARKRSLSGGSAWDRANADVDLTPLVACTNALYGFARYGHVTPAEVIPMAAYA